MLGFSTQHITGAPCVEKGKKPPGNILSHGILTICKTAHASLDCQVGSISSSSHSTHLQSNKLKQLFHVASKLVSIRILMSGSWGRPQRPWPASLGDLHHPWPRAHHLHFSSALGTKSWPDLYHRYPSPALSLALPSGWNGTPTVRALPTLVSLSPGSHLLFKQLVLTAS